MYTTPLRKQFLILLLLFAAGMFAQAQTDTLFWFAAPEVSISTLTFDRPIVVRLTTGGQAATVTISQPAGGGMPAQVVNVAANSTQTVDLSTWIDVIENKPADVNLNYGLKIQSTAPVTAYYEVVSAQCQCNPEIFVLKGQNALGTSFWIPSQNYLDNNNGYSPVPYSAFDIVATENNTTITITPSNSIVGHTGGTTFTVTLNQGQTYSATAASVLAAQHLQGSRVIADKPIAITIKDDLLNGGPFGGCSDLGGDQIVPIGLLGTEYVAMKGFLNAPGDQVFVTAIQNGTTISQDGSVVTTINAGQTYQLGIPGSSTYIQTSAPVYVLQLSGFGCEIGIDILPPIICTGSFDVSFTRSTTEDMFINVMVRSGGQNGFLVNGSNAVLTGAMFTAVPGTGGLWLNAQVSLPVGSYPQGTAISVSNSTALFHLGLIHGGPGSGTRFGYFSNFARIDVNAQANAGNVCVGSGIQLTADTIPLATYAWTGPSGFNSAQQNPFVPSASANNSGNYIVQATVLGCVSPPDTIFVAVNSCFPDTDGDGITDEYDIDDDNDGITDAVECGGNSLQNLLVNGGFEQPVIGSTNVGYYTNSQVPGWETTSTDTTIELWANNFNGVPAYSGAQHAEINYTQFSALYQDVPTTPGDILVWYCAHRGRLGTDVMEVRIGDPNGTLVPQGQYTTGNTAWAVYSGTYIVPAGQTTSRFAFQAVSSAGGNPGAGNFLDEVTFYNVNCNTDTDGDGIPNSLDLDSDNDGIYDLVEAGHGQPDANNDGRIDGANAQFGTNGLYNTLETNDNISGTINYTVRNTDNAGPYDFLSLNSDGDTCLDVVEAGYTTSDADGLLGTGTPVVNANGVVTGAGAGYTTPASAGGSGFDFQNGAYNACECHIVYTTTVDTGVCQGTVYTLPDNSTTTTTGTYIDTLVTAQGCDSIVTTNLTVYPTYSYTVYQTICPSDMYALPGGGSVNTTGVYYDTLNTIHGCDSVIITNLTVVPPTIFVSNDTQICKGNAVQLNASGGLYTYAWAPTTNLSDPNIANPVATPTQTTSYVVTTQVASADLIGNGGFESGNAAFTSSYVYQTDLTPAGTYYVGANPNTYHSGFSACPDHTSGTGNMMIVNGAGTPNTSVWCQTINVSPNTNYAFGCWAESVTAGSPAILQFSINSGLLGAPFSVTSTVCQWQQFYAVWNSGANTTADICIVNQNTTSGGNDFAIDDISFISLCNVTDTVTIVVHNPDTVVVNAAICNGDVYTFPNGSTGTVTGADTSQLVNRYGCDSTVITNLTVYPTYADTLYDTVCQGTNYNLPDGTVVTTTGTYTSTLQSINGCDSVITTYLQVWPVSATAVYDTVCTGTTYTLPDGNTVTATGTYPVTLTNIYGCDSVVTTYLTVITVTLTAPVTNVLCYGQSNGSIAAVAAGGVVPYTYTLLNNGAGVDSNTTGSFAALAAGSYSVTVYDAYGCTATAATPVTEPAELLATDTVKDVRCFGENNGQLAVVATGGTPAYTFSLSGEGSNSTGVFSGLSAGNYTYTVTDVNGCTVTVAITITEPQAVELNVVPLDATINLGDTLQLNATSNYDPATTYTWSPAIGLSCVSCPNPVVTTYNNMQYTVQVVADVNGNSCVATQPVTVTVIPRYDLFIPNTFTPNNDGNNDVFKIFGNLQALKYLNVQIFNRIGEKVFESNDLNFSWDGTYQGKPHPAGVLVYTLKAVFVDNHTEELYTGSLTLMR
ncbi:MAG: hypothetical protein RLZZ367_1485 [Bacteroidota bacterium]|jgi:gliding motility-associated-like protein